MTKKRLYSNVAIIISKSLKEIVFVQIHFDICSLIEHNGQ